MACVISEDLLKVKYPPAGLQTIFPRPHITFIKAGSGGEKDGRCKSQKSFGTPCHQRPFRRCQALQVPYQGMGNLIYGLLGGFWGNEYGGKRFSTCHHALCPTHGTSSSDLPSTLKSINSWAAHKSTSEVINMYVCKPHQTLCPIRCSHQTKKIIFTCLKNSTHSGQQGRWSTKYKQDSTLAG